MGADLWRPRAPQPRPRSPAPPPRRRQAPPRRHAPSRRPRQAGLRKDDRMFKKKEGKGTGRESLLV
uniref:Uncharacterized protein n=1 Tax=Arundo donax TaxID=35708 RepID=A0A0A9AXG5_ARUDO